MCSLWELVRNLLSNLLCDWFFIELRYSSSLNSDLKEDRKDNLEELIRVCFQNVACVFIFDIINISG
jgi:hypothetical protein